MKLTKKERRRRAKEMAPRGRRPGEVFIHFPADENDIIEHAGAMMKLEVLHEHLLSCFGPARVSPIRYYTAEKRKFTALVPTAMFKGAADGESMRSIMQRIETGRDDESSINAIVTPGAVE